MLIDFKIHDSKRADEILSAIAAKKREIDDLCLKRTAMIMAALKINETASRIGRGEKTNMSPAFWEAFFQSSGVCFWCMFFTFWIFQLIKWLLNATTFRGKKRY